MGKSSITMYGGTNIDYIHIERTTANKSKSLTNKYIPILNQDTVFLVTFEEGIQGTGLVGNLEGYIYTIYREDLTQGTTMDYVTTIRNGDLVVTDYNIANHHQYQYFIFVETNDYICNPQESNVVNTCWGTWSLIGLKETETDDKYIVDTDNIWKLNLALESGEQVQNIDRIEYKNLTKFPKISQGRANYISGSVSCFLGDVTQQGRYIEDLELLNKWRTFINNSDLKLLKDRKGNRYIVQTMSSNNTTKDETMEQINVINFGWTQVEEAKDSIMIESAGEE